ncbi:hypothetical protein OA162_04075 [Synechococcus sp. AH-736-A19]|nr:hypothetical protein [Synechococcus sp. AH-736-A19]
MKKQKQPKHSGSIAWNLLICGPIVQGDVKTKAGDKYIFSKSNFNCCETIAQNVRQWGHLFKKIIFVTWTDQEEYISYELKSLGIEILLLNDPGRRSSFSNDSRVRVMTATTGGIEAIGKPYEHVMRIRSDQQFNLNSMITSHQKAASLIKKNQESINAKLPHISGLCFWLDRPYSLCNFAHAGSCSDLHFFADAQIRYRHASSLKAPGWPEGDTIRKHLLALAPRLKQHGYKEKHCFPALPKSIMEGDEAASLRNIPKDTLRLWEFSLKHLYSSCSPKALETLVWKGEKYPNPKDFHNGMRFYKDWKRCAKGDLSAIFNYSHSKFSRSNFHLLKEITWVLHGKPEQVQGLNLSKKSLLKRHIQDFLLTKTDSRKFSS